MGGYSGNGNTRGEYGANRKGIEVPVPTKIFSTQQKSEIVSEFKKFAVKNMRDNVRQFFLENFIKEMNQSALR